MTRRTAAIDVGTNSIKMLVAEAGEGGEVKAVHDEVVITRLGEALPMTGRISPEAMSRSLSALCAMSERARRLGAREIRAVGTECARRAENTRDLIRAAKDACGVDIRIITGEEEAELSFEASLGDLLASGGRPRESEAICFFDIGGGSSEVVISRGERPDVSASLPIGALVLHEKVIRPACGSGSVPRDILAAAEAEAGRAIEAAARIATALSGARGGLCIGSGGTLSALCRVTLGGDTREDCLFSLSRSELAEQIELFASKSAEERAMIPGMERGRADIILAGACVLGALMDRCGAAIIRVSRAGLRYGLARRTLAGVAI